MKKVLFTLLLIIGFSGLFPEGAFSQTKQPIRTLAVPGDTIWILINSVKADKRADYERFLHEIFYPGAGKLSKAEQKVFRQTRILHPVAPEADGTYSYFFIMDPLIPKADYDIEHLLTKMYGAAKAKEHLKVFTEALTGNPKQYKVLQSRH